MLRYMLLAMDVILNTSGSIGFIPKSMSYMFHARALIMVLSTSFNTWYNSLEMSLGTTGALITVHFIGMFVYMIASTSLLALSPNPMIIAIV